MLGTTPCHRLLMAGLFFAASKPQHGRALNTYAIAPQKPAVGLYVGKGASLPDLADAGESVFDGVPEQRGLRASLVLRIETNHHACRNMGGALNDGRG